MLHRRGLALFLAGLVLTAGCGPVPLIVVGVAAATGSMGGGGGHHGGGDNNGGGPGPSPGPPLVLAPTAPSGLNATASGATRVDLTWSDASATDHSGFKIQRRTAGTTSYSFLGTIDKSVFTYSDQSGVAGTDYEYQVIATSSNGDSLPSNTASATTWMTIASISPSDGPIAGGTSVTISGAGFRSGATVSIAGSQLVNVVVLSSTTIAGVTSCSIAVGQGDVVVSGPNGQSTLSSAFNYRLGLTQLGTPIAVGGYSASDLVPGDFNNDGKIDLAYVARDAFISVLLGDGTGAFPTIVTTSAGGHNYFGLAAGDLDHDGKLDVVTTDIDNFQLHVYLGDGTGHLTDTPPSFTSFGPYPESLVLGDFNEDGHLDAAVALFGSGTGSSPSSVAVLLGDGAGHLGSPTNFAVLNGPQQVALTSKGMDSHLDVFSTNVQSQAISFLRGKGDGTFQTQVQIPVTFNTTLGTGDFNHTGRPQVFIGFASSSPVLASMDQAGNFQTAPIATKLAGHKNCVVVDLNRDGYPDVIAMASSGTQHSVFLNDRNGGFVEYVFSGPECGTGAASSGKLAAGDFDGDGRVDVAFASAHDNTVTVFVNK